MARSKKVFVDSSVLITALISPRGGSFYILTRYRKVLSFFINEYVLDETLRVLKDKFAGKDLEYKLYFLIGFSKIEILPNPKKKDLALFRKIVEAKDAPILASALEHTDFLLTLDNDFLAEAVVRLAKERKLQILKPAGLISLFKT